MVTLLKEVAGFKTTVRLGFVAQIKKACMKKARERDVKRSKRCSKTVMRLDHIQLMIESFYKRPTRKVSPLDRRFLV